MPTLVSIETCLASTLARGTGKFRRALVETAIEIPEEAEERLETVLE